jgi:hypothetical protein
MRVTIPIDLSTWSFIPLPRECPLPRFHLLQHVNAEFLRGRFSNFFSSRAIGPRKFVFWREEEWEYLVPVVCFSEVFNINRENESSTCVLLAGVRDFFHYSWASTTFLCRKLFGGGGWLLFVFRERTTRKATCGYENVAWVTTRGKLWRMVNVWWRVSDDKVLGVAGSLTVGAVCNGWRLCRNWGLIVFSIE